MKRPDPVLEALDALRDAADVAPFLRNRSHRVVAKAAGMQAATAKDLVEAFRRLLPGGAKSDPGCVAKLAIVKALIEREDPAAEVYFSGARHVQLEASWGEPVDTAAELRGVGVIGLARMAHREALFEAVKLLSDKEAETRIGALRALADSGNADAELVLRFKADSGDRKPEVMGECFAALLRLGPKSRAVSFVAGFLEHRNREMAEGAAIALGESRMAEAWHVLRDAFERSSVQSAILLGMSLLRNDEAIEFLFGQIEHGRERAAVSAIDALSSYRGDSVLRERMERIVGKSAALRKAYQDTWG